MDSKRKTVMYGNGIFFIINLTWGFSRPRPKSGLVVSKLDSRSKGRRFESHPTLDENEKFSRADSCTQSWLSQLKGFPGLILKGVTGVPKLFVS